MGKRKNTTGTNKSSVKKELIKGVSITPASNQTLEGGTNNNERFNEVKSTNSTNQQVISKELLQGSSKNSSKVDERGKVEQSTNQSNSSRRKNRRGSKSNPNENGGSTPFNKSIEKTSGFERKTETRTSSSNAGGFRELAGVSPANSNQNVSIQKEELSSVDDRTSNDVSIFSIDDRIIELRQNLLVTNAGNKVVNDEFDLSFDPHVASIFMNSGLGPIQAKEAASISILNTTRDIKVQLPYTPLPGMFVLDSTYFESMRLISTGLVMSHPSIRHEVANLNLAGFNSYENDAYFTQEVSLGGLKGSDKEGVPEGLQTYDELISNANIWTSKHAQTGIGLAGKLLTLALGTPSKYQQKKGKKVQDEEDITLVSGDNFELKEVNYRTNVKGIYQWNLASTTFNQPSENVMVNYSGDVGTLKYKQSKNKVRKALAKLGLDAINSAFNTMVKFPAMFSTLFEQPVILSTFIKIMLESLDSAIRMQGNMIRKNGMSDPFAAYIMGLKRVERANLKQSLESLNRYLESVPVNMEVINQFRKYGTIYKTKDGDINEFDNTLIIPVFTLSVPATAELFRKSNDYTKDKMYEILTNDKNLIKYGDQDRSFGAVSSAPEYNYYFKSGSIFMDFINFIDPASDNEKDGFISISRGRLTDFMASFLTTLLEKRPNMIEEYLTDTYEFWKVLHDINAVEGTIFSYGNTVNLDLLFREGEESEIKKLSLGTPIIGEFPKSAFIVTDMMSDQMIHSFDTTGFDRGRYFDNTINFVLTKEKDKIHDGIIYLKHAAISRIIVADRSQAVVNIGCHNEVIQSAQKQFVDTDGENRVFLYGMYGTTSINPFVMQFIPQFLETGWRPYTIDETNSNINDRLASILLRSAKTKLGNNLVLAASVGSLALAKVTHPPISDGIINNSLKFSSNLGLYNPLHHTIYNETSRSYEPLTFEFKIRTEPFIVMDDTSTPYHLM